MSEKFGVTMSQEFQVDIPLEFSHEQQNFRLLEIPSELLGLITSEIPPRYPFLPKHSMYFPRTLTNR